MKTLVQQTSASKYFWTDGEFEIYFRVKETAYQYKAYYGGIVILI